MHVVAEFVLLFLVKIILTVYASNPVSTTIHPLAVDPVTNSHWMMDAFTPSINVAVTTWTSVVRVCMYTLSIKCDHSCHGLYSLLWVHGEDNQSTVLSKIINC